MSPEDFAAMVKEFNECDAIEVGGRLYIAKDKVIVAIAGGKLSVARLLFESRLADEAIQ